MVELAGKRGVHDTLAQGDTYDLVIASLIDEHLPDLTPFYAGARRLTAPGGSCVLIAYQPQPVMVSGMPTHYIDDSGEDVAITTHVHLISDHVRAARAAGWNLAELSEATVGDAWVAAKSTWERFRSHPIPVAFVWD